MQYAINNDKNKQLFMFCKECGAEIPDDAKHCSECGAKVDGNSSNGINVQEIEKKKSKKKWYIICGVGLLLIFGFIAYMTTSSSDIDSHVYTGLYKALDEDGWDIGLGEKASDHYQVNAYKGDVNMLINISTSSEDYDVFARDGNEIQINNITAYEYYYDEVYILAYKDNNNSIIFCTDAEHSDVVKNYVRDY